MSEELKHGSSPRIVDFYAEYRLSHDTSEFIRQVRLHYTEATLLRVAIKGSLGARRAAVLALGFIGDEQSNTALGHFLHDHDLSVRLMAENSIKALWPRIGILQTESKFREALRTVMRLILLEKYSEAVETANILIEEAPYYPEARNQRSIALFALELFEQSILDSKETLELNPFHFGAAVAMGYSYLKLNNINEAMEAFEQALEINPNLNSIRRLLSQLQESLQG